MAIQMTALTGVSQQDMQGKGNVGRPNPPGVSPEEMQRILDELPREVLAPAISRLAAAQNDNNTRLAAKVNELSNSIPKKAEKANVLEKDNVTPYTPRKDYHPATVRHVREQIEAHGLSDQLHISEEERKLGRLAEKISVSAPAGSFTPAPGADFALTADSDVALVLNPPGGAGGRFLSMRGFLSIGPEGSADWGEGIMFADGKKPVLAAGSCYLLEYFYHPKTPEGPAGGWSVRCTRFQ